MAREPQPISPSSNRMLVERNVPPPGATSVRDQDGEVQSSQTGSRRVTVNLAESPLTWLMARGLVSERQFLAGERLRADWTLAGLGPRVTMRWNPAPAGAHRGGGFERNDPTLTQISARKRFDAAIAHAGSGLSDILWRVICAGEGLSSAETGLGWPKRAGKLVLCLALDRIADFYVIR